MSQKKSILPNNKKTQQKINEHKKQIKNRKINIMNNTLSEYLKIVHEKTVNINPPQKKTLEKNYRRNWH